MKLIDLIEHNKSVNLSPKILNEGISHPEDLIFDQGVSGAKRAVQALSELEKHTATISLKWDGFPAIIFGRDRQGRFILSDKHMFDKMDKSTGARTGLSSSSEEFINYDQARGADRNDLYVKEKILRTELEKLIPNISKNRDKFYFGDLLWAGPLEAKNRFFTFTPNTVKYQIEENSELGKKIAKSQGGIAVHTFIPGLGQQDEPLKGIGNLPKNGTIVFLSGEMEENPTVNIDAGLITKANETISRYSPAAEKFIEMITAAKAKGIISAMKTFITFKIKEGNFENLTQDFLKYLPDRLATGAAKQNAERLLSTIDGKNGVTAIWNIWAAIVNLKISIKKQLDSTTNDPGMPVKAFTGDETAHEGYVIGASQDKLKLIDRLGFSKANFAKTRTDPKELSKRAAMPLASFCFGRCNPPTFGHKQLIDTTAKIGGGNTFIFFSSKYDSKTDPLDYHTKLLFAKKLFPQHANQIVGDPVLNPLYAANHLYRKGFRNLTFVAGSDRLGNGQGSLEKILRAWNSGEIRSTDTIIPGREEVALNFVSSGDRDPDSEGIKGYSGTKARAAAVANNKLEFYKFTGANDKIIVNNETLFDAVRKGMRLNQLKESGNQIVSPSQLKTLEIYLDNIWNNIQDKNDIKTDLNTSFSKHFIDRVNDIRNGKQITIPELQKIFRQSYATYGKKIVSIGPEHEAVFKDMSTNINIPFILHWNNSTKSLDLVAKTVMRTKNFNSGGKEELSIREFLEPHKNGTIALLYPTEECAENVKEWCISNNLPCLDIEELHCTVLYSKVPVEKLTKLNNSTLDIPAKIKGWKILGETALVLELYCPKAEKLHNWMIKQGGTHDYPEFISHMTISYDWDKELPDIFPNFLIEFNKLTIDAIDPDYTDTIDDDDD